LLGRAVSCSAEGWERKWPEIEAALIEECELEEALKT
jgi:hypothetical protein